ncbi:uncharacterized protein LOC111045650 [Nilaparvata lugens]|uniref:uncharacterized protein LOC111045650 n=1 Tax=Nilaparvata lugens TaxID=108931 RepID=UPI00193E4487|nr:uncharacterized protein LOC111045650 [Nilaparvata lugens]XP_039297466.1 uncharacterized protein LOC111045650 [Nilaparvata lugens]
MFSVTRISLLFGSFGIFIQSYVCSDATGNSSECTRTIKLALTMEVYSRMIEVAWDTESVQSGDWIGVYSGSVPTWLSNSPGVFSFPVMVPQGRVVTNISADSISAIKLNVSISQSLIDYSACYWRKTSDKSDEAFTTTKFYTFPNWQGHYWEAIKGRALTDIFLPGTVNSACYTIQNPHTVIAQLALGIRYLDIRISMHNLNFYAAYYSCCQTLLNDVLNDLLHFITHSKNEVVILDITSIKNSSSKFQDNGIEYLKDKTLFQKIVSWFRGLGSDNEANHDYKVEFDDYLLSHLNQTLRVDGEPIFIERDCEDGDDDKHDGSSIYKKTLEQILPGGSKVIISYPYDGYEGRFKKMIWKSYMSMFNWSKADVTEYFIRQGAFPEFIKPNQLFYAIEDGHKVDYYDGDNSSSNNTDSTKSKESDKDKTSDKSNIKNNSTVDFTQVSVIGWHGTLDGSSTEFRSWGIDEEYNLTVNILLGQYFRNIGNVKTAFIWNQRLTSNTSKCDPKPSPDSATWYHEHNIVAP